MASVVKAVLSERNVFVLAFTGVLATSFSMLSVRWMPLYQLELGATPEIVGVTVMLTSLVQLLLLLPGGILADRFGRKKVIVAGWALIPIASVVMIAARNWQQLILGQVLQSAGMAISAPATQALIADSLPRRARGSGFGAYRMLMNLPMIVTPIVGGMLMDRVGLVNGMVVGFYLSLTAFAIAALLRAKFLRETLRPMVGARGKPPTFSESVSSLSRIRGTLLAMLIVEILSAFVMLLIMPFETIYAVSVKGFTKTQWGLVGTVMGTILTILSLPGGMISDRLGRRPMIFLGRVARPLSSLGLILLPGFNQVLFLSIVTSVGLGLGGEAGGPMSGPAWQALKADLVPAKDRGKVLGFFATIAVSSGLPAPVIGGYLYRRSPAQPFLASVLLGLIPLFAVYFFVKEPQSSRINVRNSQTEE
jgi:MFS family permease